MVAGVNALGLFDNVISNHIDVAKNKGLWGKMLAWFHLGRVPLLVLLIVALAAFAIAGIALQSLIGAYVPAYAPPLAALAIALTTLRRSGRLLARLFPNVNTSAVSEASFIGLTATVVGHLVTHSTAAEAKLTDEHGHTHYILVTAAQPQTTFKKGDVVIVNARVDHLFTVIHPSSPLHPS